MKKISITIPNPCHEDWNEMTPNDQGRFCSSCQKTVVDFSVMTDRQITEFFRKPKGSTCGRFYTDQLVREISLPKKSIPWAQYLFKATWPAFVLFLKSCTERQPLLGKVATEAAPKVDDGEVRYATVGFMLSEVTPVDTTKNVKKKPLIVQDVATHAVGQLAMPLEMVTGDTILLPDEPVEETAPVKESCRPLDTVVIAGYPTFQQGKLVAGGISVVTTKTSIVETADTNEVKNVEQTMKVYPNPAQPGSKITIAVSSTNVVQQLRLVAANGSSILLGVNLQVQNGLVNVSVPGGLSAGAYYLQMITDKQKTKTAKLILLN